MDKVRGKIRGGMHRAAVWLSVHRRPFLEYGKTVLILVLLVSAVFLSGKTGLLGDENWLHILEQRIFSNDSTDELLSERQEYSTAAQPLVMAVSPEAGTRYAAAFSSETAGLYERFSTYLGEALGSAGAPQMVTQTEWETVLGGEGVYFDYVNQQSMLCIAAWQGTQISREVSDHWASRFFLAIGRGNSILGNSSDVTLYYCTSDGLYYRCSTALAKSNMEAQMELYASNGAVFAFENEAYDALEPYTMLLPGNTEVPAVSVTNPGIPQSVEETMLLFGMNYITASNYPENDGGTVYVDGTSTLRLAADGSIAFERSGGQAVPVTGWNGMDSLPDVIEGLYQTTEKLTAGKGYAGIRLTGAAYDEEKNTYSVCFDYYIDGMQVCLPGGCAVEYTVSEGRILQAEVRLREYQLTGGYQTALTFPQAAALVTASGGQTLVRVYQDSGDSVSVSWLIGTRHHA